VRTVTVALGNLSLDALGALGGEKAGLQGVVRQAVKCYLADESADRAGWPYPDFRRGGEQDDGVEVQFSIGDAAWAEFVETADRQGVSTERLLQHAILYFIGELDSGRVTQRILDDLEDDKS
jgi:hypothetical protein